MREIKFRGKRIDNDKWVYGDLIHCYGADAGRIFIKTFTGLYEVDPTTVGEYTGLKDNNGTEIYEDDILLDESGVYAVVGYLMGTFSVDFGEGFDLQYFNEGINEICDVVGNIHDNPELLK